MKKKLNLKISIFELVVYILFGLMAVWGVTYICLGFACDLISPLSSLVKTNDAIKANTNGMGFLEQGILILSIAVVVIVIVLMVNAKKSDREFEKDQRRAARIASRGNQNTVIDAEVKEVSEK